MRARWLRLIDWFRARFLTGKTVIPREPVSIRPIGVVRNGMKDPQPNTFVRSDIILREELTDSLDGIDGYSHVIVIFAYHRVPEAEQQEKVQITGDPRIPEQGVLATRAQTRPSPIGVTVARLLRRRGNILRVDALDAIDGSPVLDIKPYFPNYDAVADARTPSWADALRHPPT